MLEALSLDHPMRPSPDVQIAKKLPHPDRETPGDLKEVTVSGLELG